MKPAKIRPNQHAFTLNELLLIIILIAALVWMFIPYRTCHPIPAGQIRAANNGKNIVLAIISATEERKALGLGSLFPSTNACVTPRKPNHDYTSDRISESYFADLLGRNPDENVVENLNWHLFAGDGIPSARTAEEFERGGHNIWNYIAALDEDAPDDTPFLLSSNAKIDRSKLEQFTTLNGRTLPRAEADALLGTSKPFGKSAIVFIQKGGGFQIMQSRYFQNPALFTSASRFDATNNANAKVIAAANSALNFGKDKDDHE
jgi:hypothetical protein